MRSIFPLLFLFSAAVLAAPPQYQVTARLPVDGPTRWDLMFVDAPAHRLYLAHGTQTDIIDTARNAVVGRLEGTRGVHAVAVADPLGLVFTSNGADNESSVY